MNKLTLLSLIGASSANPFNSGKAPGTFLDVVIDDEGNTENWIMAPKPGYQVPFDLRSDELVIMSSDLDEVEALGVIKAEFWNVGGD